MAFTSETSVSEKSVIVDGASGAEVNTVEDAVGQELSPEHREYLLQRHKTLDLVPMPSADPADPLNWPAWKKNVNLWIIAFHGLMAVGSATAAVPAFGPLAELYRKPIDKISYIGSIQLIALAWGPLLWTPVANRYGRRYVWLASVLGAGLFNVGCGLSQSYGVHLTMRVFSALFISPGMSMGQAVVAETFFAIQRATKMGIWALFISISTPMGPFIMGFVVQHKGWRWIYWILAMLNLLQFILYALFSPETVYVRESEGSTRRAKMSTTKYQYFNFRRITPEKLQIYDYVEPLIMLGSLDILLSTIAYAVSFNFVLVLLIIEIPAFFTPLFHLNPQQLGINNLGLLIGCVIGECVGGPFSDWWRKRKMTRTPGRAPPAPEHRLWLAHIGFPIVIAGLTIFCVRLAEATPLHWNITPIIGIAFAGFGNQIVTTVLVTYCSDCHPERRSSPIGVAINVVRCTWGFCGPFWFPNMFASCGLRGAAGLMAGLIIVCSVLPIAFLQYQGRRRAMHA